LVVLVHDPGAHADPTGHRPVRRPQQHAAGEHDEPAAAGGLDPVQRGAARASVICRLISASCGGLMKPVKPADRGRDMG
jgi:hypothetical protein